MMKDLIAKKYIKALSKTSNEAELYKYLEYLHILSDAYNIEKFRDAMDSYCLNSVKKKELIISIIGNSIDAKFLNFLSILAEHKRFNIFGELYKELSLHISMASKEYKAILFSDEEYSFDVIKNLEEKFGNKLGVKLQLEQFKTNSCGVKLVVDDLNVEISFSRDRFIKDLKNHILNAF